MEMGIQPHRPSPLFQKRAFSLPSWPSAQPSSSLYLNRGQPHFFQAALPLICYSNIIPGDCCYCLYKPVCLHCLVPELHSAHLPGLLQRRSPPMQIIP